MKKIRLSPTLSAWLESKRPPDTKITEELAKKIFEYYKGHDGPFFFHEYTGDGKVMLSILTSKRETLRIFDLKTIKVKWNIHLGPVVARFFISFDLPEGTGDEIAILNEVIANDLGNIDSQYSLFVNVLPDEIVALTYPDGDVYIYTKTELAGQGRSVENNFPEDIIV